MHEVGHTLGLRHNFRASTVYTAEADRRPGVHREERPHRLGDGLQRRSTSRSTGEKQGEYVMSTLGPYDYWAIEYALQADRRREARRAELATHRRAQRTSRCSRTPPTRTPARALYTASTRT